MKQGRTRVGGFLPMNSSARQPDAAAEGDFAWPPPAADFAGCSIVMLDGGADCDARTAPTSFADEPEAAFPDVDVETALAEFSDLPTTPKAPSAAPPAPACRAQAAPASASWWKAEATRTIVALSVGAALVLLPSPGLTRVRDAQPLAAPAPTRPRVANLPRTATANRVRVAPAPETERVTERRAGESVPRDEDHIRTTLTQLQAAYSRLDAGAAQNVWPSVDVDGLARAFDGLRFQELRFDHCDVTVNGARARAACTGEAVYVRRVGNPASSSGAGEWTFELTRASDRWMIVSARAS